MAKIYTKVGDAGNTSLVGGQKVAKSDRKIEGYGTVDEMNSIIGWARVAIKESACRSMDEALKGRFKYGAADSLMQIDGNLEKIQNWLFDLGSLLACNEADREKFQLNQIKPEQISWFELEIDAMTAVLPPLKNFILPSGSEMASRLHVARTVVRRAERIIVDLADHAPALAIPMVNRLSDYLFVLARYVNSLSLIEETLWTKY